MTTPDNWWCVVFSRKKIRVWCFENPFDNSGDSSWLNVVAHLQGCFWSESWHPAFSKEEVITLIISHLQFLDCSSIFIVLTTCGSHILSDVFVGEDRSLHLERHLLYCSAVWHLTIVQNMVRVQRKSTFEVLRNPHYNQEALNGLTLQQIYKVASKLKVDIQHLSSQRWSSYNHYTFAVSGLQLNFHCFDKLWQPHFV